MDGNEDLDNYSSPSDVVSDGSVVRDVDYGNIPLLRRHLHDLDEWIAKHNTFDVIDEASPLSGEQQIGMHRELVKYLRKFRGETVDKLKEFSNE